MKKISTLLLSVGIFLLAACPAGAEVEKDPVKVACVGNSITYGARLENPGRDSYPAVLGQLLGAGWDVRNFGVSARTLLSRGDHPYIAEKAYRAALDFQPDIVTVKLGTNDTKPWNWSHKAELSADLEHLVRSFQELPSHPRVIVCLPVPAPGKDKPIREKVLVEELIPILKKTALRLGAEVLDLHTPLDPLHPEHFPDQIHPDAVASARIAEVIYGQITGKAFPTPEKIVPGQPFPGVKSEWNGADRYDFTCAGRKSTIVVPEHPLPGNPWVLKPAFFNAFPFVEKELLKQGYHITYCDVTHFYGSARGLELLDRFYKEMTDVYHLSKEVVLVGMSRGGHMAVNWAAHRPDRVSALYLDAPVCNLASWPGKKYPTFFQDMLVEWGVEADEVTVDFPGNAFAALPTLRKYDVPIMLVCGDSDQTVPFAENGKILFERYRAMGGNIQLILKPGCDHHPHSLTRPEPVVDFIMSRREGQSRWRHIERRGSLANSFRKFAVEKKGNVAFFGGSITEMKGWHDMVMEDLRQRFPDTEFTFTEAGIGSTGSTPHAFRMENDVLSAGVPDLLFIEAAVNDNTNGFGPAAQVRGMEGVIRHALTLNPEMDIVMQHFIYEPFIAMADQGKRPDVVLNHERVANHYGITSIDHIQEIHARMKDGQFTWKQFGGTHPSWFGHKFYAGTLNELFDEEWSRTDLEAPAEAHPMPELPLEPFCYDQGTFVDIREASVRRFEVVEDWTPAEEKVNTRNGFVHVPMLVAQAPGASLSFTFEGRAVGIFCVSGPQSGIISYRIDKGEWKETDTYTRWSHHLYLPWVYMFADELGPGEHVLELRTAKEGRTGCWIRNFVVNR